MKKSIQNFNVAFVVILFINIGCVKSQTFNPYLAAKLDSTLIAAVPQQVKGVSASIYVPGQGIWRGTYGVSYAGHPITNDMEFGIASNTKLFTATTIMKLVEANKLNLNDHLGKWVTKKYNNIDSTISIKQLLYHTSGLSDNSIEFFDSAIKFPSRVFTVEEILGWQDAKFAAPSANKFNYSNTNYMLLGMIAENATGFHISKLIRDSILTPRSLDSTFYSYKETVLGTIAHPWVSGIDKADTPRTGLNSASGAAGAIYSTAADMAKWYNALFSGQIVNANSLAQMTTFLTGANQFGFGMQKRVVAGITTWGHGGKTLGYLSEMFYEPSTKTVACAISNSDSASVAGTGFLLLKTVIDNLPDTAKTITGIITVCQGQNAVTYTVPIIARATSYTWTLPNGATGTSQTNSITVNFSSNAASGNITVSGTNLYGNGTTATLEITVKPQPSSVITANGTTSFCSGGSVMLTAGVGSSYLWSNGATTQSINVANSGNYSVTIIGANGCSISTLPTVVTTINNATPTVSIQSNTGNTICAGTNVVFTATLNNGGNAPAFQWKKNGVNVGSNSNTYSDNGLANNDSVWCVLTSSLGCVTAPIASSNKIKLTVNSLPAVPSAISGTTTSCTIGGTNNLSNATNGGVWSSSNTAVATISNVGKVTAASNGTSNITYTVTNASGCSQSATAIFTVAAVTIPPITGLANVCVGATVQLSNATPNGVWSSLNNRASVNANGLLTGLNGGEYPASIKYTVTNVNGCSAFANYAVTVNAIPNVPTITYAPGTVGNPQAGAPTGSFCVGKKFRVVATPNVPAGVWSATGAASIAGYDTVKINAVGAGSIKYTYTSAAGCVNSRTMSGNGVTCASRGIATNEKLETTNEFSMYPNPAKSFISLNVNSLIGAGSIVVTDLYGKTVKAQPLSMGTNTVDIANLSKGMYFVSTITSEGKTTKKLIVE